MAGKTKKLLKGEGPQVGQALSRRKGRAARRVVGGGMRHVGVTKASLAVGGQVKQRPTTRTLRWMCWVLGQLPSVVGAPRAHRGPVHGVHSAVQWGWAHWTAKVTLSNPAGMCVAWKAVHCCMAPSSVL